MSRYLQFATESGGPILVEVDGDEVASTLGVEKAGLRANAAQSAVASAESAFEEAVASTMARSVDALAQAVTMLAIAPAEVELSFGLKATGELGNMAIAKVGGEANFSVRLVWRPDSA
jgi:hypothetical protein